MKLQNILILIVIATVLFACEKEDKPITKDDLIGEWKLLEMSDSILEVHIGVNAIGNIDSIYIHRDFDGSILEYNYKKWRNKWNTPTEVLDYKDTSYYMELQYIINESYNLEIDYNIISKDNKSTYNFNSKEFFWEYSNTMNTNKENINFWCKSSPCCDNEDGLILNDIYYFSGTRNKLILTIDYDNRDNPNWNGETDVRKFRAIFERVE